MTHRFSLIGMLWGALLLGGLFWNGCAENKEEMEKKPLDSILSDSDTSGVIERTTLPEGRTELPTWNTAAPNLFVDLPSGLAVQADSGGTHDRILLYPKNDPGLADTTLPALGLMQIVVTDQWLGTTIPAKKLGVRKGMIGSMPGLWYQYLDTTFSDYDYRINVLELMDFFASLGPNDKAKDLKLWIYVAGRDSAFVEQLLGAASSISITP